jgi:hypothetical protein
MDRQRRVVTRSTFGTAEAPPERDWIIEITRFAKKGGPLTKKISLERDGKLVSDASKCLMNRGTAHRVSLDNLAALGTLIHALDRHEAIALGALRPDLPNSVKVITKHKLALGSGAQPSPIARTGEYILFQPRRPALALLDFDTKGMPSELIDRLDQLAAIWRRSARWSLSWKELAELFGLPPALVCFERIPARGYSDRTVCTSTSLCGTALISSAS